MIGGTTMTHNVFELDYCFEANLNCLLALCDEVVVAEAESTDGTKEYLLKRQAESNGKLKIIGAKWGARRGYGPEYLRDLADVARLQLTAPYHVHLQADEVIHENDFDTIRDMAKSGSAYWCNRHNFYPNLQTTTDVSGRRIIRFGPTDWGFSNDAGSLQERGCTHHEVSVSAKESEVSIFHYGFVRHPQKLLEKCSLMAWSVSGDVDCRLDSLKTEPLESVIQNFHPDQFLPYEGTHPSFVQDWIKQHPYLHV